MSANGHEFTVKPEGWEPEGMGGRRLRYDVSDLVDQASEVSPRWVSVVLSVKDAESACRQLRRFENVQYVSKKSEDDKREVIVSVR